MLPQDLQKKLIGFLQDDHYQNDVTSNATPERTAKAVIVAREPGVLAGLEEAQFLFEHVGLNAKNLAQDGTHLESNQPVLEIHGNNRDILRVERTALNVLGRMSGVATACKGMQDVVNDHTKMALTRKTMPGFGAFDKKAAHIAGIWPHRLHLEEAVLIKENHLRFFASPADAVAAGKKTGKFVEIECESVDQVKNAATAKPDLIMLDNFILEDAATAIRWLRQNAPDVKIEVSGAIQKQNLADYAVLQPDYISMGALTKHAKTLDFSLDLVP
ncbi:carboxylating nicotinate-nucleotide diphosphorylase [Candidatus Micrarchaeota archaeon]|nr:carboxylating nicotinate-nucleotide diphosphorylase [Candidatus Micrarchaeota archaeon]